MRVLCLFLLLATVFILVAPTALIIDPPANKSIILGQTVTCRCSAIGTFISWEVNGMPISAEQRSDGFDDSAPLITLNQATNLRSKNITVLGTIKNNGSKIVCSSLLTNPLSSDSSDPVVICVKFPVSERVSNITLHSINSTTVCISWSPPFTLEGVPILGYNVTITNIVSRKSETISVDGNTTMLCHSINQSDPDNNNFTITVVPINGAGPGEPATIPHIFPVLIIDESSTPVSTPDTTSNDVSMTPSMSPRLTGGSNTEILVTTITLISIIVLLCFVVVVVGLFVYKKIRSKSSFDLPHEFIIIDDHSETPNIEPVCQESPNSETACHKSSDRNSHPNSESPLHENKHQSSAHEFHSNAISIGIPESHDGVDGRSLQVMPEVPQKPEAEDFTAEATDESASLLRRRSSSWSDLVVSEKPSLPRKVDTCPSKFQDDTTPLLYDNEEEEEEEKVILTLMSDSS